MPSKSTEFLILEIRELRTRAGQTLLEETQSNAIAFIIYLRRLMPELEVQVFPEAMSQVTSDPGCYVVFSVGYTSFQIKFDVASLVDVVVSSHRGARPEPVSARFLADILTYLSSFASTCNVYASSIESVAGGSAFLLWKKFLEELQRRNLPAYAVASQHCAFGSFETGCLTINTNPAMVKALQGKAAHLASAWFAATGYLSSIELIPDEEWNVVIE